MDRNFILALVMSMAIVLGYQTLVLKPKQEAYEAAQAEAIAQAASDGTAVPGIPDADDLFAQPETAVVQTHEQAIASTTGRLTIDTPELSGSINLRGLTFDDLTMNNYHETVDDESPLITILAPQTLQTAQFLRAGVAINGDQGIRAEWTVPDGIEKLTTNSPVTLTRDADGVEHRVVLSVDDHFMFTLKTTVINKSSAPITVQPFGVAYQKSIPNNLKNFMILFEGPLGIVGEKLTSKKYKNLIGKPALSESGTGGWVGITDKLFLGAVIPPQDKPFTMKIEASNTATPVFRSQYTLDPLIVEAGQETTVTSYIYGGAKDVALLRNYQKPVADGGLGISRFDMAVDWGNFFIFTRPIFNTLHFFNGIVGNYGIAILILTLCIKAVLFPLANMSYKSMAGMRKVQPEMTKIRERYKDDQQKQQQEMMQLYKKYKINPAAGCLPILAQMPIFYALYKTLFVTIEMRHEPFLYIRDLSERDPTSIFNVFGLLPFDPSTIPLIGPLLVIGVLPLLMGAGMWVQMKLNPPPTDPMQAKIFSLMPLIFLFIFAPFAAGLVLYWAWNTFLSVVQQYFIMKRHGAEVDLIGNIKQSLPFLFKKTTSTANDNSNK